MKELTSTDSQNIGYITPRLTQNNFKDREPPRHFWITKVGADNYLGTDGGMPSQKFVGTPLKIPCGRGTFTIYACVKNTSSWGSLIKTVSGYYMNYFNGTQWVTGGSTLKLISSAGTIELQINKAGRMLEFTLISNTCTEEVYMMLG